MNFYKILQILLGVVLVGILAVGVLANLNRTTSAQPAVQQSSPATSNGTTKFNF